MPLYLTFVIFDCLPSGTNVYSFCCVSSQITSRKALSSLIMAIGFFCYSVICPDFNVSYLRWNYGKLGLQHMQFAVCVVTAFKGCVSSESCGACSPQKTGTTACCYTLISACRDSTIKLLSRLIKVVQAKV